MSIILQFALFLCTLLMVSAYAFQWRRAPWIAVLGQIPWLIHGLHVGSYGVCATVWFFIVYHSWIGIYAWPPRPRKESTDGEDQAHQEG